MLKDHGEKHGERLVLECAPMLGLPTGVAELSDLRKGDKRKVLLAALLRKRTTLGYEWIAKRLHMGLRGKV